MRYIFTITGAIFTAMAAPLFYFKHIPFALSCVAIAVGLYICSIYLNIKKDKEEKLTKRISGCEIAKAISTDPSTDLVIKSISDDRDKYKTIQDIHTETSLPLKTINKAVDFLYMGNFVSEEKGRHGKTYVLTPEGRKTFSKKTVKY